MFGPISLYIQAVKISHCCDDLDRRGVICLFFSAGGSNPKFPANVSVEIVCYVSISCCFLERIVNEFEGFVTRIVETRIILHKYQAFFRLKM